MTAKTFAPASLQELVDVYDCTLACQPDAPGFLKWSGLSLEQFDAWEKGTPPAGWTAPLDAVADVLTSRAWTKWGFCGCGNHDAVWAGIREVLEHAAAEDREPLKEHSMVYAMLCDVAGLTEHGGSVYGAWITDDGQALLDVLRAES